MEQIDTGSHILHLTQVMTGLGEALLLACLRQKRHWLR